MSDILTERTDSILRVQLNRPAQKNAMTSAMYTNLADILNEADKDDAIRVVLWHSTGNVFCAGNDVVDFLKNPPRPGAFPQGLLMDAFVKFEKPIVAAVQGAAIGGGTTMLTHCDFIWCRNSDRAFRYRRAWAISGRRNCTCWENLSLPRGRRSWAS
jgi:enoyl-CoA hydratase/carnithine racemase